jgi:pyrophosphatase PpaX
MAYFLGTLPIKAVVFDLDHTLLDSWQVHREAVYYAADKVGVPRPSEPMIVAHIAGSLATELKRIFEGGQDEVTDHYLSFYREHHLDFSQPFPGVLGLLEELRGRGLKLGLLTNKRRLLGSAEVRHFGIGRFLDTDVYRDDTGVLKPDSKGLLHALSELDVSPSEAIMVGDAAGDIQCGKAAGAAGVAALWGAIDTAGVLAAEPDAVWHTIEDALQGASRS